MSLIGIVGGEGGGGDSGVTKFDGLTDTPSSKAGQAGKVIVVNAGETALEYQDPPSGDMTKAVYDSNDSGRVDGVDTLPTESYADGELLRYDSVQDKMVSTGIIDTDTETDFNDKTLIAGTGSVVVGRNTQSIENLGTNLGVVDLQTGIVRASVDTVIGSNVPLMRQYSGESIVNGNLDDNSAISTTADTDITLSVSSNASINSITLNFLTAYDFIRLSLLRDGIEVWSNRLSTTFSGAYEYELTTPIQINNDGSTYIIRISSETGAAYQYRGRGVDLLPYYTYKKQGYKDVPVQAMPDSTGVVRGGELTYQTTTQFEINNGFGYVVSVVPFDGNDALYVEWGQAAVAPSLGSDGVFLVYINADGDHLVIDQALTANDFARDNIILGFFVVASGEISRVETLKFDVNETHSQMYDMFTFLGLTRKGIDIGPATGLSFSASSGQLHGRGIGSESGSRLQNVLEIDAVNPAVFDRMLGNTFVDVATDATDIDPNNYDDAGALTAVPSNDWQIMNVYKAPVNAGGVVIMYGQKTYATLADAELGASTDQVNVPTLIANEYNLLGRLLVWENATDITDPSHVKFLAGAKFGSSAIAGSLGGGAGGGDMFGAASSKDQEIVRFSGTDGKVAATGSDILAGNGVLQRASLDQPLTLKQSGNGSVGAEFTGGHFNVDSTNLDAGYDVSLNGTPVTSVAHSTVDNVVSVKNIANNFGLHFNPVTGHASLSNGFTAGYALDLDHGKGVLLMPNFDTVNGTLLSAGTGSEFYDSTLHQMSVRTDSGVHEVGNTTVNAGLAPAATVPVSFKENYSVFNLTTNQATLIDYSNPRVGHKVKLVVGGGFPVTLSPEFNQLNLSESFDVAATNVIEIECTGVAPDEFYYTVTKPFNGGVGPSSGSDPVVMLEVDFLASNLLTTTPIVMDVPSGYNRIVIDGIKCTSGAGGNNNNLMRLQVNDGGAGWVTSDYKQEQNGTNFNNQVIDGIHMGKHTRGPGTNERFTLRFRHELLILDDRVHSLGNARWSTVEGAFVNHRYDAWRDLAAKPTQIRLEAIVNNVGKGQVRVIAYKD